MQTLGSIIAALTLLLAPLGSAFAQGKIGAEEHCAQCAMHLAKFPQSLMRIGYVDGTKSAVCSLHCAALNFARHQDVTAASVVVGDYGTRKLVDAGQASWVIVGGKPGVMTARAKWAFERRADAEAFVKDQGGVIATFQEALQAAREEIAMETAPTPKSGTNENPAATPMPKTAP